MSRGGEKRSGPKSGGGRQGGSGKKKSHARGNAPVGKIDSDKPSTRGNAPLNKKTGGAKKKTEDKKDKKADGIRLNKYVANSGVCSRRDADIYISAGNVTVNGKVVTEMGHRVQLNDEVKFDGRRLNPEKKEYYLLNKPKGFYTTSNLEEGNKTVMDLMKNATKANIKPVGKLDRHTSGLLLFTNDGAMAKKLATPKNGIRQIYHVELNKNLEFDDLKKIQEGLTIDDSKVKVTDISYIENQPKREVGLELKSTKKSIVQSIFASLGYEIVKLDRVVYAGLTKKDLPRGFWRKLTEQEVINLGMIN